MMGGHGAIRRLTLDERLARDEYEAERYQRITAEIEDAQRAAYEEEFGPAYRAKRPFRPHGVHEQVMQRIREEQVGL